MVSKDKKSIKLNKKRLINSFRFAIEGIKTAYKEEQNIRVHTIVAIVVIILGVLLKINSIELAICIILIGLVLMAEFFNTSIENMVDMITLDQNPYAKKAKDIAAAGVLVFAVSSMIIGLMIFVPKIIDLLKIL